MDQNLLLDVALISQPDNEGNVNALATTKYVRTNHRWLDRKDDILIDCLLEGIIEG